MTSMPRLEMERLILRPFTMADAPEVQELAGEWEIAATTANIPHPYEDGMAEAWIASHEDAFSRGESVTFAIALKPDGPLVGAIGLHFNQHDRWAELGYWIGKPYWNSGFATEAAKGVLVYAFHELGFNRVQARHMTKNPSSGRVMQKIGMEYEGRLRQQLRRFGDYEDVELYAVLRQDYEAE